MYQRLSVVALLIAIVGCSSTGGEVAKAPLDWVSHMAGGDVLSRQCPNQLGESELYKNYRLAASQLASIYPIDQGEYAAEYQKHYAKAAAMTRQQLLTECQDARDDLAEGITFYQARYQEGLARLSYQRRQSAQAWAAALSKIGEVEVPNQPTYIPIPAGQVTFGEQSAYGGSQETQSGYQHYIVNTPEGQKQCHVAESGYVFCT